MVSVEPLVRVITSFTLPFCRVAANLVICRQGLRHNATARPTDVTVHVTGHGLSLLDSVSFSC